MPLVLRHDALGGPSPLGPPGGLVVAENREAVARLRRSLIDAPDDGRTREVITLAALRARVATAVNHVPPPCPAPALRRIALRAALDDPLLDAFGPAARTPGFLAALERTLVELRAARITPERLAQVADRPPERALAAAYAATVALIEPVDLHWALVDAAEALTRFPPVSVVGVDEIIPPDWALLRRLARHTHVRVTLLHAPARRAFAAREGHWNARRADADRCEPVTVARSERDPRLAALIATVFEDREPPALAGGAPVELIGCAGTPGLYRAALSRALVAHRSGVPWDGIAVIVPRLAQARADLDRLADAWRIPIRRVTRRRVLETPIGSALLALLRVAERPRDDPRAIDDLLQWLRSPYAGADRAAVDALECALRRPGARPASRDAHPAEPVGELTARLVGAGRRGLRAQIEELAAIGWEGLQRIAGTRDPTPADLLDRAALDALAGLVDGAANGDPAVVVTEDGDGSSVGPRPAGALGWILAELTIPDERGPRRGLTVLDYAAAHGHHFRVAILCGLDGDGLPGRPVPDPFLAGLRPTLGGDLAARAGGTEESRLRCWHALAAADERLVVIRRLVDDDGREVAPSPYWMEVCRVIGRTGDGAHEPDVVTGARGELLEPGEVASVEREALRRMALERLVTDTGPLAVAAARRVRARGLPADAFADLARVSVTDVEQFVRCPYGWFHDRYLRPRELAEPFDARAEGTLAHTVLERVYRGLRDEGVGPCGPATRERYRERLARELRRIGAGSRPAGSGAEYDHYLRRLARHLEELIDEEADFAPRFVPERFELRLRDETLLDVAPPLALTGSADRVDRDAHGNLVVVDYKRGGAKLDVKRPVEDRLQLPLYGVLAARALVDATRAAGGFYLGVLKSERSGAVRADVTYAAEQTASQSVAGERWEELLDETVDVVRTAARAIRSGQLAPPPWKPCSGWCRCEVLWR